MFSENIAGLEFCLKYYLDLVREIWEIYLMLDFFYPLNSISFSSIKRIISLFAFKNNIV